MRNSTIDDETLENMNAITKLTVLLNYYNYGMSRLCGGPKSYIKVKVFGK